MKFQKIWCSKIYKCQFGYNWRFFETAIFPKTSIRFDLSRFFCQRAWRLLSFEGIKCFIWVRNIRLIGLWSRPIIFISQLSMINLQRKIFHRNNFWHLAKFNILFLGKNFFLTIFWKHVSTFFDILEFMNYTTFFDFFLKKLIFQKKNQKIYSKKVDSSLLD